MSRSKENQVYPENWGCLLGDCFSVSLLSNEKRTYQENRQEVVWASSCCKEQCPSWQSALRTHHPTCPYPTTRIIEDTGQVWNLIPGYNYQTISSTVGSCQQNAGASTEHEKIEKSNCKTCYGRYAIRKYFDCKFKARSSKLALPEMYLATSMLLLPT